MEITARERGKTKIKIKQNRTFRAEDFFRFHKKKGQRSRSPATLFHSFPRVLEAGTEAEIYGMSRIGIRGELEPITAVNAVIPVKIITEARSD